MVDIGFVVEFVNTIELTIHQTETSPEFTPQYQLQQIFQWIGMHSQMDLFDMYVDLHHVWLWQETPEKYFFFLAVTTATLIVKIEDIFPFVDLLPSGVVCTSIH